MPTPAIAAALASLAEESLIPERKKYAVGVRQGVFDWLDANKYHYIPSGGNFFMVKVDRPGAEVTAALAERNIHIGGSRPMMQDWVRVSIGTKEEMQQFQTAFAAVMALPSTGKPVKGTGKGDDTSLVRSPFDGEWSC